MATLSAFTFITLNGFFKGANNDTHWHQHGAEESQYGLDAMQANNILLFGRVTYEMMAGFWPSEMAKQNMPQMAENMNKAEKIVFSRSLQNAGWNNTRVVADMLGEVNYLKQTAQHNLTILGSGSIVTQLAEAGLIDSFEIMVDPVVLGSGTSLFANINKPLSLHLTGTRAFKSGVILLTYNRS